MAHDMTPQHGPQHGPQHDTTTWPTTWPARLNTTAWPTTWRQSMAHSMAQFCGWVFFSLRPYPPHAVTSHPSHFAPTPLMPLHPIHMLLSSPLFPNRLLTRCQHRLLTRAVASTMAYHNLAVGSERLPTDKADDPRRDVDLQRRKPPGAKSAECFCDCCQHWVDFRELLRRKRVRSTVTDNRPPSKFECTTCYGRTFGLTHAQSKNRFRVRVGGNRTERGKHFDGSLLDVLPLESNPTSHL